MGQKCTAPPDLIPSLLIGTKKIRFLSCCPGPAHRPHSHRRRRNRGLHPTSKHPMDTSLVPALGFGCKPSLSWCRWTELPCTVKPRHVSHRHQCGSKQTLEGSQNLLALVSGTHIHPSLGRFHLIPCMVAGFPLDIAPGNRLPAGKHHFVACPVLYRGTSSLSWA